MTYAHHRKVAEKEMKIKRSAKYCAVLENIHTLSIDSSYSFFFFFFFVCLFVFFSKILAFQLLYKFEVK